jgi:hypothetical protein
VSFSYNDSKQRFRGVPFSRPVHSTALPPFQMTRTPFQAAVYYTRYQALGDAGPARP